MTDACTLVFRCCVCGCYAYADCRVERKYYKSVDSVKRICIERVIVKPILATVVMMASLHTVFGIFQTDLTKLHEILTNLSVWKGMDLNVVALELNSALPEQLSTAALSVSGFLMGRPEANKHHNGNANPNHNDFITLHLSEWIESKRQ